MQEVRSIISTTTASGSGSQHAAYTTSPSSTEFTTLTLAGIGTAASGKAPREVLSPEEEGRGYKPAPPRTGYGDDLLERPPPAYHDGIE